MEMIFLSIYFIINFLVLASIIYAFLLVFKKNETIQHEVGAQSLFIDGVIPCKNDQKNLDILLNELQAVDSPILSSITVVDDGSHKPLVVPTEINCLRLEKSLGKTKAIKHALENVSGNWLLIIDADVSKVQEVIPELPKLVCSKNKPIFALPFGEKLQGVNKVFQFEESALKLLKYASFYMKKPMLLSSAFLLIRKDIAEHSLSEYDQPNGWDMHLLKRFNDRIHYIHPSSQFSASTGGDHNYTSYLKQRSRWITNGLRTAPLSLGLTGGIVYTFFLFDYVVLAYIFTLSTEVFLSVLSLFFLKAFTIYLLSKKWLNRFNIKLKAVFFFVGYFFYGLNITIILIFLMLRRFRLIKENGTFQKEKP